MDAALLTSLVCPQCRAPLHERKGQLACSDCGNDYPLCGRIPCLYPEPGRQLADWRRQAQRFVELTARSVELLGEQEKRGDLLPATRGRLERLRAATAENAERLVALLSDAGLAPDSKAKATGSEFTLIEYYTHLLRDWAWDRPGQADGTSENERARDLVLGTLGTERTVGRVLVLGAGPARLAYDLHVALAPELTVALDINPLLLLAGARTIFDEPWRLWEFPPEPQDLATACVERVLQAPQGKPERFHLVLADAFATPFAPGSFDTVVTPWFIDIVPVDIRQTLALVHGLLAPGGRWLNFGPLAYKSDHPHHMRYTAEELFELADLAGFTPGEPRRARFDFLASPASGPVRNESVLAFAARKRPSGPAPAEREPPAWLMLPHLPIPRFTGLDGYKAEHALLAYLIQLIDGKLTLQDLAARMIKDHGARPEAALEGTRQLLTMLRRSVAGEG
jgi:uncharacterized protein YbaR (Trm112 family)